MKITIVGGGNIGTQYAVHCAHKGHQVTLYTSRPQCFSSQLSIVDAQGNVSLSAPLFCATADPQVAFSHAEVVFITVPADCMSAYADRILTFLPKEAKLGLIPGTGGGECVFRAHLDRGGVIFGMQRVPSVARLIAYGKTVCATGYRPELFAAALPNHATEECCQFLQEIFDIPCKPLANYLSLTLTPSNPILHTTRLRTLFRDYTPGTVYPRIPLFYQEWNDESSRLLLACDEEVQRLCRTLCMFDLSGVKSLKTHYESDTPEALTYKISHIPSFQNLSSPQKEVEGGYIPDFSSRYFTADFPYGLAILVQVAQLAGVETPHMEATLQWYDTVAKQGQSFSFKDWGIHSLPELVAFYSC